MRSFPGPKNRIMQGPGVDGAEATFKNTLPSQDHPFVTSKSSWIYGPVLMHIAYLIVLHYFDIFVCLGRMNF